MKKWTVTFIKDGAEATTEVMGRDSIEAWADFYSYHFNRYHRIVSIERA